MLFGICIVCIVDEDDEYEDNKDGVPVMSSKKRHKEKDRPLPPLLSRVNNQIEVRNTPLPSLLQHGGQEETRLKSCSKDVGRLEAPPLPQIVHNLNLAASSYLFLA